jgi:hypothetical protein
VCKFNSKNTIKLKISKDAMDFYQSLSKKTRSLTANLKKKNKKILLLSSYPAAYTKFKEDFPDCKFVLVNSNENELNNHNEKTYQLDIFNGSALTDFLMKYGKFDLIILIFDSKTYQKRNLKTSILFLFKHFIRKRGYLVLAFNLKDLYEIYVNIFSKSRYHKNLVTSTQSEDSSNYLIFFKKLMIFGEK